MTDLALIDAHRSGDHAALGALVARHRGALLAFLRARVGEDAEELHQELWLRVDRFVGPRGSRGFDDDRRFRAWLYRVARNLITDHHRRAGARPRLRSGFVPETTDAAPRADSAAYSAALWRDVTEILDTLHPGTAEVVRLRLSRELRFVDIAEHQGVPLNTVLGRMHRGLRQLREQLVLRGHEPPSGRPS